MAVDTLLFSAYRTPDNLANRKQTLGRSPIWGRRWTEDPVLGRFDSYPAHAGGSRVRVPSHLHSEVAI